MEVHLRQLLEGTFEAQCSSTFFLDELFISVFDYLHKGLDIHEGTFPSEIGGK